MDIAELHKLFVNSTGITTDTRNLKSGALFFALKGTRFNGNKYAQKAIEEGCLFAIVDEDQPQENPKTIRVNNVLKTLQNLANYHRKQFDIPIIGITGSNGKTTSKELMGAVLSKKYNVLMTEGNLNNHLGVPFTLLKLTSEHQIAIIEMGANKPGDIKELVEIAEPTYGVITNVGAAHIEGFGSLEGVINTKKEMYTYISDTNGFLFYNKEDTVLNRILPTNIEVYSYGEQKGKIKGQMVSQSPFVNFNWMLDSYQSSLLKTKLVGRYNFTNFLLAIAVGTYFEVSNSRINAAIENYTPSNNRSQVQKTDRNTLIIDCYNANATSMQAALESFVEMEAVSKLAILGDMLELGSISNQEHKKIISFLEENNLNAILVGAEMAKVESSFPHYLNWELLLKNEGFANQKDVLILLKGSRGIQLEKLIEFL